MVENVFAERGLNQQGQRGNRHNEPLNAQGDDHDQQPHNPNSWETSFRYNIPEFLGTLNPEDFID